MTHIPSQDQLSNELYTVCSPFVSEAVMRRYEFVTFGLPSGERSQHSCGDQGMT